MTARVPVVIGADGAFQQLQSVDSLANVQTPTTDTWKNLLVNAQLNINQLGLSGTVTLAAGQYGHDGLKAGASGATYTFTTANGYTIITLTANTLIWAIEASSIQAGVYRASQIGTAKARVWQGTGTTGTGSYVSFPFTTASLTANTQTNLEFQASGTIALPQFEFGSNVTLFEWLDLGEQMRRCQRYYRVRRFNSSGNDFMGWAGTGYWFYWEFDNPMYSAPSFSLVNGNWAVTPTISAAADKITFNNGSSSFYANGTAGAVSGSASARL